MKPSVHCKTDSQDLYTVQCEIPYDFIRKRLTIQVKKGGENLAITKGALNSVLDICDRAETENGELIPIESKRDFILNYYQKLEQRRLPGIGDML